MKYFIAIVTITGLLVYGASTKISFSLNVVLILLLIVILTMWEYSILGKDFKADFKMRSHKKSLDIFNFCLLIGWTFLLGSDAYEDGIDEFNIFFIIIWWVIPLVNLLMYFVYKKKKPITIFVDGDELTLNNRWLQTRNLKFLITIDQSRLTRELNLNFKGKSEVSIPVTEYELEDLEAFLKIIIAKTKEPLAISPYVLKTYKNISIIDEQ